MGEGGFKQLTFSQMIEFDMLKDEIVSEITFKKKQFLDGVAVV